MIRNLDLALIDPDPDQPRQTFAGLDELAESLAACGLIEPITVTPDGDRFKILVGERRFRAAQSLGWTTIAALVDARPLTPSQRLEIQTAENEERSTLTLAERMAARLRAWQLSGIESQREYCAAIGRPPAHLSKVSTALAHLTARPDDSPQTRTLREEATAATQDGRLRDADAVPLLFKVPTPQALRLLRQASAEAPLSRLALKKARREKTGPAAAPPGPRMRVLKLPEPLVEKLFDRLGIVYDPGLAPGDQLTAHFQLEAR